MAGARSHAQHLLLRGSVWYFRMAVPLDLRGRVGLSEVRISLRTGYAREANTKARRLATAGTTLFMRIRNNNMPKLDRRELARMVKVYFNEHLLKYEDHVILNGPDTEERLKESLEELTAIRERAKKSIALGRYYTVAKDVAEFTQANELEVASESPEYRIIAHELLKANLDMLTVLMHRQQGDYGQEDAIVAKYAGEDAQPVQVAPAAEEEPGITLFELIDKYCEFKIKMGRWTGRSISEQPKRFSVFKLILGDMPVASMNADTAMHVLDCLQRLPMRLDAARFRGKSLEELLEMEDEKHLSVKSINMRMEDVTGLFNYAVENDYAEKNYFRNKRLRDDVSDEEKRLAFTDEDLALIFDPETYLKHCGKDVSRYWLPILGLYTGARLEELAQLHVEDIREEEGILVLDINDKGEKRVKNKSSKRLVPVHSVLRHDLGFEPFVADQRKAGHELLFPKLPYTQQRYGHKPSRDFSRYIRSLGLDERKTFHSFRHTFIDRLRNKDVRESHIASMTGHKPVGKSPIPANYKGKHGIHFVVEKVLSHVGYNIDLSHPTEWKTMLRQ